MNINQIQELYYKKFKQLRIFFFFIDLYLQTYTEGVIEINYTKYLLINIIQILQHIITKQ